MGRIDIIAIDGSPQSRYAFDWYLENLYREGNTVVLAHVVEYGINIGLPGIAADVEGICAAVKRKNDEVEAMSEEFMSILRAKTIPAKRLILNGNRPGEEIVKAAADEGAELIIMGTRGLGKIRRTFLGSVSEHVIHHAHCPVTIVRQSEKPSP
ncbi:unnamed protein product [Candidula unifasciata]|uniref:UspA domain-containing protein n=1 Tax=Candidula unifasciata TaxID=100452 RepID=A0A8S3ZE87_9EUPU|nr:unnamed protein product [Candidula unifasciata]